MNVLFVLAFVALVATVVTLVLGIRSMAHGGEEDREASTRLMFQRVEFQAAALALVLAGLFLVSGWMRGGEVGSDRITIDLGVVPATVISKRYGPDSAEAEAYGDTPEAADAYLVTVVVRDRSSGRRVEDAEVQASVGRPGMSQATKSLRPASFEGTVTYGNYFRMPKAGTYRINVRVSRPGVSGPDRVRLEYHRPPA